MARGFSTRKLTKTINGAGCLSTLRGIARRTRRRNAYSDSWFPRQGCP
jgi:hypothetical protein